MASGDFVTKRIGDNLLKGWTLLGDNCPQGCNVPLMRSRDKKSLVCCRCDTDFMNQISLTAPNEGNVAAEKNDTPRIDGMKNVDLLGALDRKLVWLEELFANTTSISDLHLMVDLITKINTLKKQL
jgi:uncharacterized Zn finger protein (UPF0148 family)